MSDVYIIAEGQTEQRFVDMVLTPYCAVYGIYLHCTLVKKPGKPGGDVKFERTKKDIRAFLKQRSDTTVCSFVDFYGIKEWPDMEIARAKSEPSDIATAMNAAAVREMKAYCGEVQMLEKRYIPFTAVHEFETLLFSDAMILAEELGIEQELVDAVLSECGTPERINNSPQTAPSKRLEKWCKDRNTSYKKTVQGVTIAKRIGIDKMRRECPLFDQWLIKLGIPELQ